MDGSTRNDWWCTFHFTTWMRNEWRIYYTTDLSSKGGNILQQYGSGRNTNIHLPHAVTVS